LPGQTIRRDPVTREPLRYAEGPHQGELITDDQYAWYNGRPVRAGYLSNYLYGYAAASADFPWWFTEFVAERAREFGQFERMRKQGKFFIPEVDNSIDWDAYRQGWEDKELLKKRM
jgi:hypothetical protein